MLVALECRISIGHIHVRAKTNLFYRLSHQDVEVMIIAVELVVDRVVKGPAVAAATRLRNASGAEGCITCQVIVGLITSVGVGKHPITKTASEDQVLDWLNLQVCIAVDVVVVCFIHPPVECHLSQWIEET